MLHEKRQIYRENYYAIVLLGSSIESHVYLFNLCFLIFGWCNGALIQIKTVEKNLILNDKHDMTCCCWLRVWFFRWQCRRTWKWWKPRGLVWSGERKGLKGISSTISNISLKLSQLHLVISSWCFWIGKSCYFPRVPLLNYFFSRKIRSTDFLWNQNILNKKLQTQPSAGLQWELWSQTGGGEVGY